MRIISQNKLISVPFEMTAIHVTGTFIRMNMVGVPEKERLLQNITHQRRQKRQCDFFMKHTAVCQLFFKMWKYQELKLIS